MSTASDTVFGDALFSGVRQMNAARTNQEWLAPDTVECECPL
jgi:hypothetical protein